MWRKPVIQYNAGIMNTDFLKPDEPTLATVAAFFRTGLTLGICAPDEPRAWALSIIAAWDEPSGEIIEISWHKPLDAQLADLSNVAGEVDRASIGYWLLARVAELPASTGLEIGVRLRQAMQITRETDLPDLFDEFNMLDDKLGLAAAGVYGNVSECRDELRSMLAKFPAAPFNFS